jgi:hypothetical protein
LTWIKEVAGSSGQWPDLAGPDVASPDDQPTNRPQPGNSATKTAPEGAVFHVRHLTDGE